MPVPDYQSLMLPTLKALSDGVETSISDCVIASPLPNA